MHFNFMCHEEYPSICWFEKTDFTERYVYDNDIFSADWYVVLYLSDKSLLYLLLRVHK